MQRISEALSAGTELRHRPGRTWLPAALIALPAVLMFVRLGTVPPLFFDEGWVLGVARNWVEKGHYGQFSAGEAVDDGIPSVGLIVTAPVALSFRLLGVGAWQARVPAVLFTVGVLIALYFVAKRLYGPSTGVWALALVAWTTPLSPVLFGKMVLGEIPALLFYLLGVLCLSDTRGRTWRVALAALFWGTFLATKVQFAPFWAVSVLVPCAFAWIRRRRRIAAIHALSFAGALVVFLIVRYLPLVFLGAGIPSAMVAASAAGVMWLPWLRLLALKEFFRSGLPAFAGMIYASCMLYRQGPTRAALNERGALRLGVLVFASSWLGWYLLLSPGWERYLFPTVFVGSIFLARLAAISFQRARSVPRAAKPTDSTPFVGRGRVQLGKAMLAVMLFVWTAATTTALSRIYLDGSGNSVYSVAAFINEQTPVNSLVETYDMELLFLLNRECHFPPDRVQFALHGRMKGSVKSVDYDPLAADPDYLVIGPQSGGWGLYDSVVESGRFRLVGKHDRYSVYERVRH